MPIEGRAELVDGILYMMGGGSPLHAFVTANIITALGLKPWLGVSTNVAGYGCTHRARLGENAGRQRLLRPRGGRLSTRLPGDPKVIFEVLSPSTGKYDQEVKLLEYRSLAGLDAIVFVDPEGQRARLVERTGAEAWTDRWLEHGAGVPLSCLAISLSSDELFALQ